MVRSQENKEFQNGLLDIIIVHICKHYRADIPLNGGFVFFDRKTRSTLWNHLKLNNMEV